MRTYRSGNPRNAAGVAFASTKMVCALTGLIVAAVLLLAPDRAEITPRAAAMTAGDESSGGAAAQPSHFTAIKVCNNTGVAASDLHLDISGGGGTLYVDQHLLLAPTCPPASIPSNNQVTDTIDIDWGVPCVPNSACVVVIVASAGGPVAVESVDWTLDGTVIGGGPADWTPLPGFEDPDKPFVAVDLIFGTWRQVVYGDWSWPGFGACWVRLECMPDIWIVWFRVIVTRYPTAAHMARGVGGNTAYVSDQIATGEVIVGDGPVEYRYRFTTARPAGPVPEGPPRRPEIPPPGSPEFWDRAREDMGVKRAKSNDGGANWESGASFPSAFLELSQAIKVIEHEPLPKLPEPFEVMVPRFGERYVIAAEQLAPLIAELSALDDLAAAATLEALSGIQLGMTGVGFEMMTGKPSNAAPFHQLAESLGALQEVLTTLPPTAGHPRIHNAAEYLKHMAEGIDMSAQMVAIGMPDTDSMDAFLWGVLNRFPDLLESFALSMLPHVRLVVDLGLEEPAWEPHVLDGAWVVTADAETGEIRHERREPINELGHIVLHTPYTLDDKPGHKTYWVKPSGHLAGQVTMNVVEGAVSEPILTAPGDVNDDNCVTEVDLKMVLADFGEGGMKAGQVPPTDVTLVGFVDEADVALVKANRGACGVPYPGAPKVPCPGDLTGSDQVNVFDLLALLACWGPITPGSGCEPADLTGDGIVNVFDLLTLLANWGPCP